MRSQPRGLKARGEGGCDGGAPHAAPVADTRLLRGEQEEVLALALCDKRAKLLGGHEAFHLRVQVCPPLEAAGSVQM